MKVWVMSLEHPEEDFRMSVYSLRYDCSDKRFSMPCPMGDDWLQEIHHRPDPLPALVKVDEGLMVVVFKEHESAHGFAAWLLDAEERAQHGYRTMRG